MFAEFFSTLSETVLVAFGMLADAFGLPLKADESVMWLVAVALAAAFFFL